ncbi:hypothetical protein, conserved [Babesia ovata]|uniref:Uncharacterized protein n=1 Tax=Babesia ovata TaxID=189622 RepID=A0A2H6K8S3_9APIC|nr:uncharacterized protein BOVATA_008710 [Babesia ovata]GBE59378.1 hypothetical protein, conserved [Babesia ovata]
MAVYCSLLEAPSNLKESLDWMVAVRRCSAIPMLAKTMYIVLLHGTQILPELTNIREGGAPTNVRSEDATSNYQDIAAGHKTITKGAHRSGRDVITKPTSWIDNLLIKLHLMDASEKEVKVNELYRHLAKASTRIQLILLNLTTDSTYVESYDRDVTWENSCAENPLKCAEIFVSFLIPVCDDLHMIQSECNKRHNLDSKLNGTGQRSVGKMLASMGYNVRDFIPEGTCRDFLEYYEALEEPLDFLNSIVHKYTVGKKRSRKPSVS